MKTLYFLIFFFLFSPFFVFAESLEENFPKSEAGITVYTKINEVSEENNKEILNKMQAFLEKEGEVKETQSDYIIGKFPIPVIVNLQDEPDDKEVVLFKHNPYIYFDIEGWLAVYFPKEFPTSRIIQWNGYTPENINSNVLQEALDKVAQGTELSYSSLSYYHFQYPEAEKMSLVTTSAYNPIRESDGFAKDNFSVTVPGKIYESSYSLYYSRKLSRPCDLFFTIDGEYIIDKGDSNWCEGDEYIYADLSNTVKEAGKPYNFVLIGQTHLLRVKLRIGVGTVFLYGKEE